MEVETVDALSTIRLLEAIEALYPMLALIHVFLDNARYHHAQLVQEWLAQPGRRIQLHFIPPLGLSKDIYAGTTSLFFTVGNATKALSWPLLVRPTAGVWELMALCLFAIPGGVWLGWRLRGALDKRQIYRACCGLAVVTALKLLWDGVSGYLA
jgi:hypothetical protein